MAEYEGNVLRPPGVGAAKTVEAPEELLAAYNPPPLKKGGTVKAGAGVLRVGEPLKLAADGKTYVKSVLTTGVYDSVVGLNYTAVDATSEDHLVNIIFSGVVNGNVAALKGNEEAVATALGGKVIEPFNYIQF